MTDRLTDEQLRELNGPYETGGFIDTAPVVREKLRKSAREQAKLNTYTWIAPGHVLALLDTVDELDDALTDTAAKAIRGAVALRARVAKLEAALTEVRDGEGSVVEMRMVARAALKDAPQ